MYEDEFEETLADDEADTLRGRRRYTRPHRVYTRRSYLPKITTAESNMVKQFCGTQEEGRGLTRGTILPRFARYPIRTRREILHKICGRKRIPIKHVPIKRVPVFHRRTIPAMSKSEMERLRRLCHTRSRGRGITYGTILPQFRGMSLRQRQEIERKICENLPREGTPRPHPYRPHPRYPPRTRPRLPPFIDKIHGPIDLKSTMKVLRMLKEERKAYAKLSADIANSRSDAITKGRDIHNKLKATEHWINWLKTNIKRWKEGKIDAKTLMKALEMLKKQEAKAIELKHMGIKLSSDLATRIGSLRKQQAASKARIKRLESSIHIHPQPIHSLPPMTRGVSP